MTNDARPARLLLVDDDAPFRMAVRKVLSRRGYKVDEARDGVDACRLLDTNTYAAAVMDLRMPRMGGLEVLRRHVRTGPRFIILTGHGTIENAVEAMGLGAASFLQKPFENEHLLALLEDCVQESRTSRPAPPQRLIGESQGMVRIRQLLARVAPSDETVCLMGETGTGKELAARTIHDDSARREGPFIALNCACVNRELFESELFGHLKGAFTGATDDRRGLFREANGGTLFIDELGELPLDCQAKLLRVLETQRVRPVGGAAEEQVNVRVVTATNRAMREEVKAGRFREDLFFRLQVVPVILPPLRERRGDIPLLADHLIKRVTAGRPEGPPILTEEAKALLMSYDWPGNVRELMNVLKRGILFSNDGALTPRLLTEMMEGSIFRAGGSGLASPRGEAATAEAVTAEAATVEPRSLEEVEREHITRLYEEMGGNVSQLARVLGIDRRTLQRKLRAYGYPPGR